MNLTEINDRLDIITQAVTRCHRALLLAQTEDWDNNVEKLNRALHCCADYGRDEE